MEALLEERADRLEAALGHFIVSTGNALSRMERGLDRLSNEMKAFKDEMRADRLNLNKEWGKLANKMGTVVEDKVPNL